MRMLLCYILYVALFLVAKLCHLWYDEAVTERNEDTLLAGKSPARHEQMLVNVLTIRKSSCNFCVAIAR